jgi:hypothetical protein
VGLKVICSGYLVRYPLGGQSWHHLQYLVGLQRLGHEVIFLEHYGWPNSCYDPSRNITTADPGYGITYLLELLRPYGLEKSWCYLAEDGTSYGISRERLSELCRESDLYLNLSNLTWIPELEKCRRRVLVDTDPVFTQIGALGMGGPQERYHVRFTYGENVHQSSCEMPTRGERWHPTRQPVVLDQWPVETGNDLASFTTISSWSPIGDRKHNGRVYGMKNREFEPFFTLPRDTGEPMEMALNAPKEIRQQLLEGGWRLVNPREVTLNPWTYQRYIRESRAEFSVAKHGYVVTRCGWFSERSAAYLASGRPVLVQETGFSEWLETGLGVVPFCTHNDVLAGIDEINRHYESHCRAARALAEEYFDARKVLGDLINCAMS